MTRKYDVEIQKMSQQLVSLRQQRDLQKQKLEQMPKVRAEIEQIKAIFEDRENFIAYHDKVVRCVVECIRVAKDKTLTIIFKSGYSIEEKVED